VELDLRSIIFYALALVAVLPGLMILFTRDIVRVAFWLLGSLAGVAGLYILLDADFLAATQVLVYIGGVMVLILFGIMMTNKDPLLLRAEEARRRPVLTGLLVAAGSFGILMLVITPISWNNSGGRGGGPSTSGLGVALLTDYVLPFEVVSVLLLVVLCGAAYVARRGKKGKHA